MFVGRADAVEGMNTKHEHERPARGKVAKFFSFSGGEGTVIEDV